MCIGMNIFDENGECYFISPLNHSSQEKRATTSKHAFAGRYIDSTLTQEVIELRKGNSPVMLRISCCTSPGRTVG